MIGNDLICLDDWGAHSTHRKERYRSKLFTPSELAQLNKYEHPTTEPLLWSMKESAFKIYFREVPMKFFAPVRFVCEIIRFEEKESEGFVVFNGRRYHTRSEITEGYLHTVALPDPLSHKFHAIQSEIHDYFKGMKRIIRDTHKAKSLEISKNELGIPVLLEDGQETNNAVSVSHDGGKIAYAWLWSKP